MSDLPALDDWTPLSPREAVELFRDSPGFRAVAGGWAIDLFVGDVTRRHGDVDIQLDRADVGILHASLPGWLLYAAHGELDLWEPGTPLPDEIHNLWCRRPGRAWEVQLMLGDFTDTEWVFRRDARIRGPREAAVVWLDGLPVMAPEIQLLYKSKGALPKDEHDFAQALPRMSPTQRDWLAKSLRTLHGEHPWLAKLG
jgi:hypothetical protein